jgi:hypothetical protein
MVADLALEETRSVAVTEDRAVVGLPVAETLEQVVLEIYLSHLHRKVTMVEPDMEYLQ